MTNPDSIYNPSQNKIIVLVIIILLGVFLFVISKHILTPLLSAVILYILFKPLFLYFTEKKKLSRSLSASLIIIISFLVIVLPLAGVAVLVLNKISIFQDPHELSKLVEKIQHLAGSHVDLKEMLDKSVNEISKWAVAAVSVIVSSLAHVFIALLVLYFTLFFMLRSYQRFESALLKYLPFDNANCLRFGKELKNTTYANIIGQGLIALCQGIIVAIGFLIFSIPDPLFWGVVSVFVCFLPVVGAPIIFVPAGIIELAGGHITSGIGILLWGGILVTIVDNFLRQFIAKKIADTHPLITIIGVLIGIPVFGIIGLVIGPFLISFFLLLCDLYEVNYLIPDKAKENQDRAE